MLKFLIARVKRIFRWVRKNKIEILDHILLIYVITITVCPGMLPAQRYRIIIGIIYLILESILVYSRATGDDGSILSRFRHKRFTEDTPSGLVKFDKNRLEEMIIFVYDLENEMDHLVVIEKKNKKK